jgi:hypothetical protein
MTDVAIGQAEQPVASLDTILSRRRAALPYRRINGQFSHGLSFELTHNKSRRAALTANHPGSK